MDIEMNDRFASFITGKKYTGRYMWINIAIFGSTHFIALFGTYYMFQAKFVTLIWWFLYYQACLYGITVGAHRLCAHRTFKANTPLKIILATCFTMAFQQKIVTWCRWHRCHHKWSDTDADPHNIRRGFFFAHIGWLMIRPHPDFMAKKDTIDMSDLEDDPVYKFQAKYYYILALLSAIILPHMAAMVIWKEDPLVCFTTGILAWILTLNAAGSINSLAHLWGMKPYNYKIEPAENKIANFFAGGEGYHNYHHTFPMDYRASELGAWFSPATRIIDFFQWIGWATELKSTPLEKVEKKIQENLRNIESEKCRIHKNG